MPARRIALDTSPDCGVQFSGEFRPDSLLDAALCQFNIRGLNPHAESAGLETFVSPRAAHLRKLNRADLGAAGNDLTIDEQGFALQGLSGGLTCTGEDAEPESCSDENFSEWSETAPENLGFYAADQSVDVRMWWHKGTTTPFGYNIQPDYAYAELEGTGYKTFPNTKPDKSVLNDGFYASGVRKTVSFNDTYKGGVHVSGVWVNGGTFPNGEPGVVDYLGSIAQVDGLLLGRSWWTADLAGWPGTVPSPSQLATLQSGFDAPLAMQPRNQCGGTNGCSVASLAWDPPPSSAGVRGHSLCVVQTDAEGATTCEPTEQCTVSSFTARLAAVNATDNKIIYLDGEWPEILAPIGAQDPATGDIIATLRMTVRGPNLGLTTDVEHLWCVHRDKHRRRGQRTVGKRAAVGGWSGVDQRGGRGVVRHLVNSDNRERTGPRAIPLQRSMLGGELNNEF